MYKNTKIAYFEVLLGKCQRKRPFGRHRRREKIILKWI
jgi:hypothetical protein